MKNKNKTEQIGSYKSYIKIKNWKSLYNKDFWKVKNSLFGNRWILETAGRSFNLILPFAAHSLGSLLPASLSIFAQMYLPSEATYLDPSGRALRLLQITPISSTYSYLRSLVVVMLFYGDLFVFDLLLYVSDLYLCNQKESFWSWNSLYFSSISCSTLTPFLNHIHNLQYSK